MEDEEVSKIAMGEGKRWCDWNRIKLGTNNHC